MTLPVDALGYEYEEGLVPQILEDLADDSGEVAPPQLQLVGTALIESLPDDRKIVTKADYDELGGAKGVLRSYLERLLERLSSEDRRPARVIIESLVRADQTRDVRTQKSLRNELKLLNVPTKNFEEILRSLRENHVLRLVETDDGMAYELVHDYLALQVELDPETTARKAAQELLNRRVRDYEQYGSLLTREEYEVINAQRDRLRLDPKAEELVTRTRNMILRQRRIAAILITSTVLGILGVLALIALVLYRDNENRQDRIEAQIISEATIAAERDVAWTTESRMLSDLSQQQLQEDTVASLNLAIQALTPRERPYVPEAEYALSRAVQSANEWVYMPSESNVLGTTWNADETKVLTWSTDGTARIFDSVTGEELLVMRGTQASTDVAWSPDEAYVLMGQRDGTIRIFEAETGEVVWSETLEELQTGALTNFGVTWNPGGTNFAVWSDEGRLTTLWSFTGNNVSPINLAIVGVQPVWSPDGSQLVTIGEYVPIPESDLLDFNRSIFNLWSVESGELIQGSVNYHAGTIGGFQWSQDGNVLLTWSDDQTVSLWDVNEGEVQKSLVAGDDVQFAAWSPDEHYIAVVTKFNGSVLVWDLESEIEDPLWSQSASRVDGVKWSQDNTRFITYGLTDGFIIWDAATGDRVVRFDRFDNTFVMRDAIWSPNEHYVLTYTREESFARIWNATTGKQIIRLFGHGAEITSAVWSSDETEILTSGVDGAARIWSLFEDGVLVGYGEMERLSFDPLIPDEIQSEVSTQTLTAVWNEDETLIATGNSDATVRIWDAQTYEEIQVLQGHRIGFFDKPDATGTITNLEVIAKVDNIAWSPDQTRIASSSDQGLAIIWDVETGEINAVLEHPNFVPVVSVTWNSDGTKILTSSDDGAARVWDANTGEQLLLLQQINPEARIGIGSAIWNKDETQILTASDNGLVTVWDANTGDVILEAGEIGVPTFGARWNQDETLILAWGEDNLAHVIDVETGEDVVALVGHSDWVITASWSPDESRILTTSRDGTARIWDAKTGDLQLILTGHTDNVTEGIWNHDGTRVMTRSVDGTVRVWDTIYSEGFAELLQLINGHSARVNSVMWNNDETQILTASNDGTARIWRSWRNIDDLITYASQFVTRPLSPEQRDAFFLPPAE
jgi:WD40 repeat protein